MAEFGPTLRQTPPDLHTDYLKLLEGIKAFAPRTVWRMPWSVRHSMSDARNDHVKELLEDPWVLNAGELPKFH